MVTLQEVQQRREELSQVEAQAQQIIQKPISQRRFGSPVTPEQQEAELQQKARAREVLVQIKEQREQLKDVEVALQSRREATSAQQDYDIAYKFFAERRNASALTPKQRRIYNRLQANAEAARERQERIRQFEAEGLTPLIDDEGNIVGFEDRTRLQSIALEDVPKIIQETPKERQRFERAGLEFKEEVVIPPGFVGVSTKQGVIAVPDAGQKDLNTVLTSFGDGRDKLFTGVLHGSNSSLRNVFSKLSSSIQNIGGATKAITTDYIKGGLRGGYEAFLQTPGGIGATYAAQRDPELKKELKIRAEMLGTPQQAVTSALITTAVVTPIPLSTKVATVTLQKDIQKTLRPIETQQDKEQVKTSLRDIGITLGASFAVSSVVAGGLTAAGFTAKELSKGVSSAAIKKSLEVTGKGIQFGTSVYFQRQFIREGLTLSDQIRQGRIEQAKLTAAGLGGGIAGYGFARGTVGYAVRRISLKQELKSQIKSLPEKERIKVEKLFADIKKFKGVQPDVKPLSLKGIERIPVKAQPIILKFLKQKRYSLIVGGSVAQRTQLQVKELRAPSDIDVYTKGLLQDLKAQRYAKQLKSALEKAGVERVALSQKEPSKITIKGEKVIEFLPSKQYIRQNLEQVLPIYRTYRAGLIKTPEGVKVQTLYTQLQRKTVAGYLDPKRIETGKALEVDIPTTKIIKQSLIKTQKIQQKEIVPLPISAGIIEVQKSIKTPTFSIEQPLAPRVSGRGGVGVSYPSYPSYPIPKSPSYYVPFKPLRQPPYTPIKPPKNPPYTPPPTTSKIITPVITPEKVTTVSPPYVTKTPPYTPPPPTRRTYKVPTPPTIKTPPPPKPRKEKGIIMPKEKRKDEEPLGIPGFRTFVIKGGKKVYLPGIAPKGVALKKGAVETRTTLRATFGVAPTGVRVRKRDISYTPPKTVFRGFKIREGKKVPLRDTFIQKAGTRKEPTVKGARLATKAEQRALQRALKVKMPKMGGKR